jgi:hypothetical protein
MVGCLKKCGLLKEKLFLRALDFICGWFFIVVFSVIRRPLPNLANSLGHVVSSPCIESACLIVVLLIYFKYIIDGLIQQFK